jgi:hypothetical protein
VSLTAPVGGSTLSGTINLSASASDNVGVTKVDFYCDSTVVGTATTSPYSVSWNTTSAANGSHTLLAKAYDGAGNSASSASITVTINNPTSQPGQLQWAQTGVCGALSLVYPKGLATDGANNVVVAGLFQQSVDFGNNTGVLSSAGGYDAFIVKYNAQGVAQWAKRFGSSSADGINGVAIDSGGNIIVAGSFAGTVDFGGATLSSVANPVLGSTVADGFVAKYSASGSLIWVMGFGGSSSDVGNAVAVDGSDNIFLAATLGSANVAFGNYTFSSVNGTMIVAKLTAQGAVSWAEQWGSSTTAAKAMAVDRLGNVVLTGSWGGGNLGGGSLAAGGLFVVKYGGLNGSYQWGKVINSGLSGDAGNGIGVDPSSGNVVVTGALGGPASFGGAASTASGGVFLAAYDANGNYAWAKTFNNSVVPASGSDAGNALSVDSSGNIALAGTAQNLNLGGGWTAYLGYFVAKFSSTGSYEWAKGASSTTDVSNGYGVAFDTLGQVVAGGNFTGTINFGGVSATTSSLYGAPFVTRYGP